MTEQKQDHDDILPGAFSSCDLIFVGKWDWLESIVNRGCRLVTATLPLTTTVSPVLCCTSAFSVNLINNNNNHPYSITASKVIPIARGTLGTIRTITQMSAMFGHLVGRGMSRDRE